MVSEVCSRRKRTRIWIVGIGSITSCGQSVGALDPLFSETLTEELECNVADEVGHLESRQVAESVSSATADTGSMEASHLKCSDWRNSGRARITNV